LIFLCRSFPDKNVLTPVKWNSLDSDDDDETSAARDDSDELILTHLTPGLVRFNMCVQTFDLVLCAQDNMQAHEKHGGIHAAQVTTIWTKTTKMTTTSWDSSRGTSQEQDARQNEEQLRAQEDIEKGNQ